MPENNEVIKGKKNGNADFYIKLKYSLKINKTCAGKIGLFCHQHTCNIRNVKKKIRLKGIDTNKYSILEKEIKSTEMISIWVNIKD